MGFIVRIECMFLHLEAAKWPLFQSVYSHHYFFAVTGVQSQMTASLTTMEIQTLEGLVSTSVKILCIICGPLFFICQKSPKSWCGEAKTVRINALYQLIAYLCVCIMCCFSTADLQLSFLCYRPHRNCSTRCLCCLQAVWRARSDLCQKARWWWVTACVVVLHSTLAS